MPQANNQFTGSKMNKDLSPRLVPNTQYIDARNATVLNSEGGESGLLQNTEGNTLLTNLNLTGENLEIIGLFSDKVLDRMFLFVTNWNDPSSNESSVFASPQSSHYICIYDIKTSSATTLVSGNFLNFSKTNPILAINLLEDLLFFTDNRNQPRKINIDSAISDPTYYTEEANISVLRYFPWNAPRLSKNILSPGETDKYPLEVKSELLITTQPLVITKSSPVTYSVPIGPSDPNGWTTSGSGNNSGARVQFDLEGSIPNIFIANAMVMGDGGNGFSIGDTITASTIWTGIPSSAGDIVFTIGSQNIAQTPTMKDVVSTNLPGAIERKVANSISPATFSCGAPVKRGVSVWTDSLSTPSMPDTPRPILLTQFGQGDGSLNFGYLPGTSLNATVGTGLEIAVSVKNNVYTVDVVSSGNNYSSNQKLKINSAGSPGGAGQSGNGPIPGLAVDIILDIETSQLDVLPANSFVGTIITSVSGATEIDLSKGVKITANAPGASGDSIITYAHTGTPFSFTNEDLLTFGANPLYNSTFEGDTEFLTEKFVRFSYRFKFDDNQYSLIAPFTQAAFIPRQDGYFTEDFIPENIDDVEANSDENRAIKSTIIEFFENKVNEVGITIDMPDGVSTPADLYDKLKVIEIDILYKDADEANIKVIDTITKDDLIGLQTNQYTYTYNSGMPIRTLRDMDFTRVADKAPIRAKAQEVAGSRVMYGNYLARTARPTKLDYTISAGEKQSYGTYNSFNQVQYPNHNLKQSRSYEVGVVLVDRFGRQSDVITSDNSTVLNKYRQNRSGIKSYLGDSLKIDWKAAIPSVIDSEGYAGLYSLTNPLGWYSYKVVVKQSAQDYYNVYLPTILNSRPQPDVLRINIETITNDTTTETLFSLSNDSEPIPDVWVGSQLQGTQTTIGAGSTATLGVLDASGKSGVFNNPDGYTVGKGWATLHIPNKNIETSDDIAFITLLGDNINKVPRDLSTSASQDLTFPSSVKLYGRVWNNRYYDDANSSRQYFPVLNAGSDSISNISLLNVSSGASDTEGSPAYISPYYTVPSINLRGGSPYIGTVNTQATIGAYGGNSAPQVSFEKLRLNVYETTPFESNIDIYYESSSSGLISQLNDYINQDSDINRPALISDWSWELNESTAPETDVNLAWFDVKNSIGNSLVGSALTGEIIKVVDGSGNTLSNTSYFTLEQNVNPIIPGADDYKFKLKTAPNKYFVYDSNSYRRDKYTFTFRFTNNTTGVSNDITTEANELDNNVPSYTAIPNPLPVNPSEFTGIVYKTIYNLDGKNGTANTINSTLFKKGLVWKIISLEFKWVGNNNTWLGYSPTIGGFGNSADFDTTSWMQFAGASGDIARENLIYNEEFVCLNVSAALIGGDVLKPQTGLYDFTERENTEFRAQVELNDANDSNGSLSTYTTIYFTLLKN
tara:strand:- start:2225 stop:6478 length:4254 start_codon:yes stop_codon:yes gene_type:complete